MTQGTTLRIILVEDEPELLDNLVIGLSAHGLDVRGARDGVELEAALAQYPADIILLDLGLPGEDGLKIAERLGNDPQLGIIIITARGMTEDRIRGLECGADNYFVKPVDIIELAVAIKNLGRRLTKQVNAPAWRLQTEASCLMTPDGSIVSLTAQECILLSLLFDNIGHNVSRSDIFTALGQPDDIYSNPRIEVLISRLRLKVKKTSPYSPLPLRARHNMGYIFLAENTP